MDNSLATRLKLKDLRVLLAVHASGGIGKAAERLNYSQPGVSKSIASLEGVLGRQLLVRTKRGVELTPYGLALVECANDVFRDLQAGIQRLRTVDDPTSGHFRIGSSEPIAAFFLSPLISSIAAEFPAMTMELDLSPPALTCEKVRSRQLDFAVVQIFDSLDLQGLEVLRLFDDPVAIVGSRTHPLASRRRVEINDLAGQRWILPPSGSFIFRILEREFRKHELVMPAAAVTAHSAFLRLSIASEGTHLTVVPRGMLKQTGKQSWRELPYRLDDNGRPAALVKTADHHLAPACRLFIDRVIEAANQFARGAEA